jgi:hypothetical protein
MAFALKPRVSILEAWILILLVCKIAKRGSEAVEESATNIHSTEYSLPVEGLDSWIFKPLSSYLSSYLPLLLKRQSVHPDGS